MATNPRFKATTAAVLEAIALVCENYDAIVNLDNVAIYSTRNDKFLVIEAGSDLYATLINSNRHPKWTINENAVDALTFIKGKTNVTLSDVYKTNVIEHIEKATESEKVEMEKELHENEKQSYRDRIAALTEKFKNDPVKLAILSKMATELSEME